MAKYEASKGPYRIETSDGDYYLFDIIAESNGSHIAAIVCQQEPGVLDPTTQANAALFRAAWELREALKDMCAVFAPFALGRIPGTEDPTWQQAPLALHAAYNALDKSQHKEPTDGDNRGN